MVLGGRFINTVAENPKREVSRKSNLRKIQLEPYVWVAVEDDRRAIFSIVGTGAEFIDRNDWKKGIRPYMPAFRNGVTCTGVTLEEIQELCDRFNRGERYR